MKTIKRKPSWPKWAKWYCEDKSGRTCVFEGRPTFSKWRIARSMEMWVNTIPGERIKRAKQVKPYRTTAWRNSLRRIVP